MDYDGATGTTIDYANLLLQTTLNGQAVVLGILPFVEEDLQSGKPALPFDLSIDPDLAYYLIYRRKDFDKPAVAFVKDWLLANIQNSGA